MMKIEPTTLDNPYICKDFRDRESFLEFFSERLENVPKNFSYEKSKSKNVDEFGKQPKGTDTERISRISKLQRFPPISIVKRKNGVFCLANGSHRLSHAVDCGLPIVATLFEEN